jgi:hypothetical protein
MIRTLNKTELIINITHPTSVLIGLVTLGYIFCTCSPITLFTEKYLEYAEDNVGTECLKQQKA